VNNDLYFKWMSWIFLSISVVTTWFATGGMPEDLKRWCLLMFAACMFVAMLVAVFIINLLRVRRLSAEEGEKARQSEERKHKLEIERSEKEAMRIREAESGKVVLNIVHGE